MTDWNAIFVILLVGVISCVVVAFWMATVFLLKPPWYIHKISGHRNRDPEDGLVKELIGAAKVLWRVSRTKDGTGNPTTELDLSFEEIEFPLIHPNRGNKILRGWLIPSDKSTRRRQDDVCIICIHGGGRDRRAFLRHIPVFHKNGCTVLLFDCEEHGISDGKQRGIGWCTYEPDNTLSAVKYAKETLGFDSVVLLGTSMGASAAILAASLGKNHCYGDKREQKEYHKDIDGVIAENPFAVRKELMEHVVYSFVNDAVGEQVGKLLQPISNIIIRGGLWRIGNKFYADPIEAIRELHIPMLIMHGTKDKIIPFSHSERLYENAASKHKSLWIVKDAFHTGLHNAAPEEWNYRVLRVIERVRNLRRNAR